MAGYFFPEQAASIYLEENRYQAFADNDSQTIVYTATPTRGITEEQYNEFKNRKHDYLYDGKLEIFRFSMFREGKNPILRALRYFFISLIQFYKGITAKNIDLIYVASTPPTQGALAALVRFPLYITYKTSFQTHWPVLG